MAEPRAVLGVDGGGSTCRVALLWQGQRHEVIGAGANVTSDFDAALAVLRDCLAALGERAQLRPEVLWAVPAYIGLAGVLDSRCAARVAAALPFATVMVEEDRPAALAGALGAGTGCVVSVGTGSFLGRKTSAGTKFIGGHGMVLGDEASGAWLGRRALAGALQAADDIVPDTALCISIRDRLGGVTGVIDFARSAGAAEFAALAPEIVTAAEADDALAQGLLAEGAGYIVRGLHALGWRPGEPVCLLGGLGPRYAPWLAPEILAALVPPRGSALDGALALAATLAERAER
ncbi:BadF/BadG/BcrA/BcrD ATPase family protein [Puniceibacterium confluentis]|uniref:BadF/BadG/BcrA/BcrD ATPase family protein n=1 Tax=Puniceibacterium confluentis TaxID=1958944 RepID=UPI0011B3729D|nr:BadF/BadG/BcrA/BcrD ATPase family protein [Puniceibacterium confluentis]